MAPPANGYGAVNSTPTTGNGAGLGNDEEQPLLGQNVTKKSSLRTKMHAKIKRDRADIVLLLCYIITGLLDSASISTWGSFVSMQTGNTVYIGLGLAAPKESNRWIKSGTSLISFCIGSFFFSRFHRYFYPSKRWVLCASFLFQAILITIAAAILTFGPKGSSAPNSTSASNEIPWNVLVPIALVAFQSCGQAVTSRALKFNALTSVVLTSIYCDLFSDAELFAAHNVERNRRVGAPLMLLLGAVIGGTLAHSEIGTPGVLWLAAGLKLLIMITWLFWRAEEE